MQYANLRVTTFCIGSPQRVFWAQEGVVGAQVEVFTGQPAVILLYDGGENLKESLASSKFNQLTNNKPSPL